MIRSLIPAALAALLVTSAIRPASAGDEPKNLKVLKPSAQLEKGMKELSKGLGVKCEACHVKGKYDSDDAPKKLDARAFLEETVGVKDGAKRDAALAKLVKSLEIDAPKRADSVWQAVDRMEKK